MAISYEQRRCEPASGRMRTPVLAPSISLTLEETEARGKGSLMEGHRSVQSMDAHRLQTTSYGFATGGCWRLKHSWETLCAGVEAVVLCG